MVAVIVVLSTILALVAITFALAAKRVFAWMNATVANDAELSETKRKLVLKTIELEVERAKKTMVVHVPMSTRMSVNSVLDDKTVATYWMESKRLPAGEKKILEAACDVYPEPVSRERLGESTGFKRSTRNAYIQRLVARELVQEMDRDHVKAVDALFDA